MPVWDTKDIPGKDRFAFWREVICEAFAALDPRPAAETTSFGGQVDLVRIGAINCATVRALPHHVVRGPLEIRRDPQESVFVNLQLTGSCATRQAGRDHILHPGDCALLDLTRPYEIDVRAGFSILCLRIPRPRLAPTPFVGQIDGTRPEARIATALMRAAWSDAAAIGGNAAPLLEDALCNLLRAALGRPASLSTGAALHRIKGYICQHLADPNLSPATAARALGMSKRTLHAAFQGSGTSFSSHVRAERLAQCAADLRMSRGSHGASIAEIGWRWGLSDPAHFSRVFAAAYGLSPRAYRIAHTPERPAHCPTPHRD